MNPKPKYAYAALVYASFNVTHVEGCQALKDTGACLNVGIMLCAVTLLSMCMRT